MTYRFSLIVENDDEVICELSCLTLEGVQEELCRKAEHQIKKFEADKESEAQAELDRQAEEEAEREHDLENARDIEEELGNKLRLEVE